MKEHARSELVSPCGRFCGACEKFKTHSCSGCIQTSKRDRCKVRACVIKRRIQTCASCDEYKNTADCPKLNSFMSKVASHLFNSDKNASLSRIKKVGPLKYAREMHFKNKTAIEKRKAIELK